MFKLKVNDQITLQQLQEADAPIMFKLVKENNEFLRQWLPWVDSVQDVTNSIIKIKDDHDGFRNGTSLELGIFYQGNLVGRIGFHTISENKSEIGYWLSQHLNGKGIMTLCVKKLMHYGFRYRHMHRIVIKVHVDNDRSNAIPKRLGFTLEGTEREQSKLHGNYVNSEVWSFLKTDTFKK